MLLERGSESSCAREMEDRTATMQQSKPSPIVQARKHRGRLGLFFGNFACTALTPINGSHSAGPIDRHPKNHKFFHLALLAVRSCAGPPQPEDRGNRPATVDSPLKLVAENATGTAPGNGLCCLWCVVRHPDGDPRHIALVTVFRNEAAGARAAPRAEFGTRVIHARGTIGERKNVLVSAG